MTESMQVQSLLAPQSVIAALPAEMKECWQTAILGDAQRRLFYFGAVHFYDASNPMFEEIEAFWRKFLSSNTSGQEQTVFFEGNFEPVTDDAEATIRAGGESAYVRLLARQAGVAEFRPEPKRLDEINFLRTMFSDEEIFSFYFVRTLVQWHRLIDGPPVEQYLRSYIQNWQDKYTMPSEWGFGELYRMAEEIAGEPISMERKNSLQRIISGRVVQSALNDIDRHVGDFRDVFMVERIIETWRAGRNLFIVYGNLHLMRQKPALLFLLGLQELAE